MEITNLMGQTQTEEQKKKEREKAAELIQSFSTNAGLTELARNNFKKLMFNPAKEAEKALIGAASYAHLLKYMPPTKEEHEQEERIRSFNESMQSVWEQQERIAREREAHRQMLIDVNVKAARIIEAEKLAQQNTAQVNVINDTGKGSIAGTVKPRKKLKPLERERNEALLFIYAIFKYYKVEYLDELPAHQAWGKIISKEFKSDLISSIAPLNKYITLSGGEKLYKTDFGDKYRKRFE
jgi:peptidyl-tRNA hydrolase